jgi:hypothetical protein
MKRMMYVLVVAVSFFGAAVYMSLSPAKASDPAAPIFDVKLPDGYRDWRLISVAHEEGNQNDLRAVLGNDIAVKAYREKTLPFPDGAIIARLAWKYVPSEENNRVFGKPQSFIAGDPTNVQFMVKNSKHYAATGGWGFAQFNNGVPVEASALSGCYGCHVPVKDRDYLFTRYAP